MAAPGGISGMESTVLSTQHRLSARKKPSQERSLDTVNRILEAATELLVEARQSKSGRTTTNHIAKRAGISVGSLYQYFPNTEAIIFELYRSMIDPIQQVLRKFDNQDLLALPRRQFFDRLNRAMTKSARDSDFVFAMFDATKIYPPLVDEGNRHAEYVAEKIAGFLAHYGSRWPRAKLKRLALYAYYLDEGAWAYRDFVKPPKREIFEWELRSLNSVFEQCFD